MKPIHFAAVIALGASLVGCSTTSPSERLAANQASCQAYGFTPNSDAFANCMMQRDIMMEEQDAARRARIGQALAQMGRDLNPPTVTCRTNSNAFGTGYGVYGNSTTTCR